MTTSIRVLDLSGGIYFNRYEAENKAKTQNVDAIAYSRGKKCHPAALVVTNTIVGYVVIEEEKDPTTELEQLKKEHAELEEKHGNLEREHEDCKSDDDVKEQIAEELRGVVGQLTEWGLKAGADTIDVWPGLVEYPEAVEIIKGAALSFGLLPKQKTPDLLPKQKTPDEAAEF